MNRRNLLALSGAITATAIAGCTGKPNPARSDTPTDSPQPSVTDDMPTGTPSVDDAQLAALAAGNASFALDLHGHLASEEGGNLFLSPYSISVALAMTYAGARGETETQMRETLEYTLGEEVHPAFATVQTALADRATTSDSTSDGDLDAFQLAVANAMWGRDSYPFADDYIDLLETHYGAGLRHADFAGDPDGERVRINDWIADNTEDRIEDLLPAGALDASTALVLTNAIYFMAGWQFEFDPAETESATFTALEGSTSTVKMMRQHLRTSYAALPGVQAIELPYVGREVSMVLLLPDEGAFEAFEQDLDADRLFGIFTDLGDASGDFRLPRFEFETSVQLSDALSALGMPIAFGEGADFGGMVEGGGGGLRIDEAYHDSFVSVDEEGTEAAAATAVAMADSAPSTSFDLTFDRPFLFCIRDRPTDAVLFLGRVTNGDELE